LQICKGHGIWTKLFLALTKDNMVIQHKQTEKRGMFFIAGEEDDFLAELTYSRQDNTMMIDHTEVDDQLRGQNIGYQLVHSAVEYARSHGMKIIPLCPFAKAVIDKKPEFRDVLKEE
jgi:uncharacterized protein